MSAVARGTPAARLACLLITLYQRHVSPRKGFCCAYRVRWGRDSCSRFAMRAISRRGAATGVQLLRRRFDRCHRARQVLDYETRRATRERYGSLLGCEQGCSPACDDADAVACLGQLTLKGCCELATACHW